MLIFDDRNEAIILDSIYTPTITDHFWVLDLNMMDYTLHPLMHLEQITCPSLEVIINGFQFILPAGWNLLVFSEETQQLDVVEISALAGKQFTALIYGMNSARPRSGLIRVVDYHPEYVNVAPLTNKHQMICHPIGPGEWINVAPSDTYNKYFKDMVVGDLIS